ncbi:dienelactone hydrolase family protein [Aquihabitans sp. G128]|uniref:alpha/beta hydrolase family protein n=1 Tax=Aquihabitans sp. G128 TaxID=2849779 RepID=UPI001C22A574|nr:dienelactone hydrolase family protein [Aquihabitans sp. G128]QXC60203.1 dienelactone hydrolase family protein [Aquihabitans sp. G128]
MLRRRALAPLLALALLGSLAACSSSDSDGTPTTTAAKGDGTTTTKPADVGTDAAYEGDGPHQVGTTSFALADGRRVVAWYPAADAAEDQPKETFDIASLLSPALQAKIPADKRPIYEIDAHPGADQATDGPFPVVLFSHGYAGFPEQSADLVTHLASWGFVVVAPDHVERSLSGLLGVAAKGVPKQTDPKVLSLALDAAIGDAKREQSPLHDLLDVDRVAVVGHSAGAGAAYAEATAEPRVKAFISYSVGFQGEGDEAPPATPKVPGMVMAGTDDGIIPFAESEKVYAAMAAPKYFVKIDGAGHLVFSDLCLIGRDLGGLAGLIKEVGLDLPAQFSRLASDGCEQGDLDPVKAFPAIDHLSVAFLRSTFGIDEAPVGLEPGVTKAFTEAKVTLTADPG